MGELKKKSTTHRQMNIQMPEPLRAYILMRANEQAKSQSQIILDLIRDDIKRKDDEERRHVLISRFMAANNVKGLSSALSVEDKALLIKEMGI